VLTALGEGLRWCFIALVLRVLVVAFGFMWSASPLADLLILVILFHLALAASGAFLVRGLLQMRAAPVSADNRPTPVPLALALLLLGCDLALVVTALIGPTPTPLLLADGVVAILAVAALIAVIARLANPARALIAEPRLAARARNTLALLAAWSALAAATVLFDGNPASDISWLSLPLGITTALVGLGLWIALLWLTHDTREALRR
jgi:hypothetical protein